MGASAGCCPSATVSDVPVRLSTFSSASNSASERWLNFLSGPTKRSGFGVSHLQTFFKNLRSTFWRGRFVVDFLPLLSPALEIC